MEILDVAMVKICLLDVLDIYVGGVGDINVTCPDEVKEVSLSAFPQCFAFAFGLGGIGGDWVLESCVLCGCGRWLWWCCVEVGKNDNLQVM